MLHVLSVCHKISPAKPSAGFRGISSQVKVWMKRDDIEAKIRNLKEHVNKCYLQFTVSPLTACDRKMRSKYKQMFSTARTEHATLRVENTSLRVEHTSLRIEQKLIVNTVESHVRLQKLEAMMAQVLIGTPFGQNVMNQTIDIIESVSAVLVARIIS